VDVGALELAEHGAAHRARDIADGIPPGGYPSALALALAGAAYFEAGGT
jgi:hypothetical protein